MIKLLLCLVVLVFMLYLFPLVKVCGYSMFPTYIDGQFLFIKRVLHKSKCKVGEVYVYVPPYVSEDEKFVIKRLDHISKDGKYYFLGDNSNDSYDSRYYGYVDSKNVVAHILNRKGCK